MDPKHLANQPWHALELEAVSRLLQTNLSGGLSSTEASRRLQLFGPNELPEAPPKPIWRVFVAQFASPLIYILFVAAIISYGMGHPSDAVVILVVVLLNAIIGAVQEGRAEHSMSALRKLSTLKVRVLRDGREAQIEAKELVPGDALLFAAGDAVGADARLVDVAALEASEAALTGESLPVGKTTATAVTDSSLGDRHGMVYAGTHLSAGRGLAIVVATGWQTEVGKSRTSRRPRRITAPHWSKGCSNLGSGW